ncbi:MAG: hypothetical protein OXU81_13130 [Gammaproteobacteria bacterium]|nr:hypothetical protein [Gammaproteobacteria bacterium]
MPARPRSEASAPPQSAPIRPWTAAEDEALEGAVRQMEALRQARRREAPSPLKRVADELGRSYGAVRSRASLLGLSPRRSS